MPVSTSDVGRNIVDEDRRWPDMVATLLERDPALPVGLAFLREQYADLLPPAEAAS